MTGRIAVTIIAVGRLREKHWVLAESEYSKRLVGQTSKFRIIEVADEPTPDEASPTQEDAIKTREADRILGHINPRDYVIALDGAGAAFDSESFATHFARLTSEGGVSAVTFVIGGSLGLGHSVLDRADSLLSFGSFTFPHQLMRIILLEQVYRVFKILRGEKYHK